MATMYKYEMWDGYSVVGYYYCMFRLQGRSITIYEIPIFRQQYGTQARTIKIPLTMRLVSHDYQDTTHRLVLDVRRKSKRQIKIIKGAAL